jgi:uncharacterized protein (DUF2267 family)
MSTHGFEALEHTVQLTHIWINDLDKCLGWNNKPRAYRLLKSVLHALRDRLRVEESAALAAQMPTLLRGVFYEQWRPAKTSVKTRSKADFLARIDEDFAADPLPNTAQAVMAVFELLSDKISRGEVDSVRHALPQELRNLWREPHVVAAAGR